VTLTPLLDASLPIQIHVATIVPAALLGPYIFLSRKGSPRHRLLGRVWVGLMVLSALSSFFIHTINVMGGFSPIHLLSAFVLYSSWKGVQAARRHQIRAHRTHMLGMYFGGVVIAGGFTLLPGRLMHAIVFAPPTDWPDPVRLIAFFAMMVAFVAASGVAAAWATRPRGAPSGGRV
jgi:uncharacterized membrane protein